MTVDYRITKINDALARSIEAIRTDAAHYDLPPGQYRAVTLPTATVYGPPNVALMNLPQLSDVVLAHRPYAAIYAKPWYGTVAQYHETASGDAFGQMRVIPSTADITNMDICLDWLRLVKPAEAKIIWMRAEGHRWRHVCIEAGCVRQTAWRRWVAALATIAKKVNGKAMS